jgi:clan AA aspartic protease
MTQKQRMQGWWAPHLSPHLEVYTPTGESLDLVVDSGFNGEIVLPKSLIRKPRLTRYSSMFSELADGSMIRTKTYIGAILWFGQRKQVLVQATKSNEGLLGTQLFKGCVVEMDPDEDRVVFRKKSSRKTKQ